MATVKYLADIDLTKNSLNNARIQNLSTAPSSPVDGQIYYDTDTNDLNVYNGSGWVQLGATGAGDIESVVAGAGMTGGASSGDATLNVIGGTGITANANDIAIDSTVATLSGSQTLTNKTIAASQVTEISNLTAAEGAQLEAIGTTTISAAQWGYLGAASGAITNTDTQLSTEAVQDIVGAMTTGNTESGITVAYQDGDGTLDFTVGTLNQNTTGLAGTATALATTRAIQTNLASTNLANFDGTAAITPGVVGTLAVGNGGTGATSLATFVQTSGAQDIAGAKTFGDHLVMDGNKAVRFRDGNSFILSPTANDIEVVATTITLDAGSDIQLEGATTVTGNLSVSGNLNIDGTTTTIDSTTVAIADSMLKLAKDQANTADALDFGFYGQYGVSGTHKYAGVFRDGSATGDPFTFFDSLQAEPEGTVNTSGTGYDLADISAGKITSADGFAGNLTGNVTGNTSGSAGSCTGLAATATALATTRAINGVNFNGTAAITVTAAAGTLSGNTLKSTVVTSSLTSVGTIGTGVWRGTAIESAHMASATASAKGAVELATTAEALAGTDTARAVTAAGLAARSYRAAIGGATSINVDHGLATRDVNVQMYDASSYETVIAQVVRSTTARVVVTFNVAPSAGDVIILITRVD